MSEGDKYIRRVYEIAVYFWEMFEENQDGDTRAIKLLFPTPLGSVQLRKYILDDLYKKQRLTLMDAALHIAKRMVRADRALSEDVEIGLRSLCAGYRPAITNPMEIAERSFLRLARYLRRMEAEGVSAHTRVFEFFVPANFVPTGRGKDGGSYREHVVPCKYLRDECLRRIRTGLSDEDIARFLQRNLAIVRIRPEDSERLDKCNELGLKETMPANWSFDTGCVYARLHEAKIDFDPPLEGPFCSCSNMNSACCNL